MRKLLYSLMLYSCAIFNRVDSSLDELCPGLTGTRIEFKKDFIDYSLNYSLEVSENYVVYSSDDLHFKLNPLRKEVFVNNKRFRNSNYYEKLEDLITEVEFFENTKWINFELSSVVDCLEGFRKKD